MSKKAQIPDQIGVFQRYIGKETTMEYGYYYDYKERLPFAPRFSKRHIRLWIPESYDFENPKPTPVLYMSDGQNLVDACLSAYGDWHLDRVIRALGKEGYPEPILVGIDCPKSPYRRSNELNPPYTITRRSIIKESYPDRPIANRYIDYIVQELKPYIESVLCIDSRKEATGIGGSSMGGIMAFYGFMAYPETFGYSHSFSPPFFFYTHKELDSMLEDNHVSPETHGKVFLYVGGTDFEKVFVEGTFYMKKRLTQLGFGKDQLGFAHDAKEIHHEEAWYRYSPEALRFWLKDLK